MVTEWAARSRQPFASSAGVRSKMQAQRSRDTEIEIALRRALHRLGLRYFVHRRPLPHLRRVADVVFPRARVAVFCCGCFWHGHEHEMAGRGWRTNTWYWPEKIERNRVRDQDTDSRLAEAGWESVRVWECEDPAQAALAIEKVVRSRVPRNRQSEGSNRA